MDETHRKMMLEWLAITLFYAVIKISFNASGTYFLQFVFSIIGVTLSIGSYLIINQQKQKENILKLIIITEIYKNMIIMFVFVALLLEIDIPFDIANVRIQLNMLELWCICICYIYFFKTISTFWCSMLIGLGFCVLTGLGYSSLTASVAINAIGARIVLEGLMAFVSIVGIIIVILHKETRYSKSYVSFLMFSLLKTMNYFMMCYQYMSGGLIPATPFIIIRTIESYYILKCTYLTCWEEPWKEKIFNLNQVEYTLSDNAYYRDMIVNLSHELKTPINVISSATDLLKLDFKEEKEVMNDLKEIRVYCNETMRIIKNMIDIHKLKGGYTNVVYSKYNLVALIENVVEAYSKQCKEAHIVFNPEEEEIYSQVDKHLFQQMILYLIYAILKTRKDRSDVYLEIKEIEEDKIQIKLSHSKIGNIEEYIICHIEDEEYSYDTIMAVEMFWDLLKLHQITMKLEREEEAVEISLQIKKIEQIEVEVLLEESNLAELIDSIRSYYVVE